MTNEELLSQISDYCRRAGMAESTFGRRAVNDGKLVHRLREGKRITIDTLNRIEAYIAAGSPDGAARVRKPEPIERRDPRANFRFFENRQKYLLFVHTCSEKRVIADRVALEFGSIHPRPPALRVFDAGVGDGTVLARVMRSMHGRFPHMPFYIAGKELSLEDIKLTLDKLPDRLFEHPATVMVLTNMNYAEAPWLAPRSPQAAAGMVWREVALRGTSSGDFEAQIRDLGPFLEENWRASVSPVTGMPIYERPVVLVFLPGGPPVPARFGDSTGRAGRSQLRSGDRIAAVSGQIFGEFQGQENYRPSGAEVASGRAFDRNTFSRTGSRTGDCPGGLARRKSFRREPS